jgi:hypothetical protein
MTAKFSDYIRGMVCAMVVIPMAFMAAYPLVMVLMPERLAILADLPRDLTVLVLLVAVLVPVFGGFLYWRVRRRAARRAREGSRDEVNTRDVY